MENSTEAAIGGIEERGSGNVTSAQNPSKTSVQTKTNNHPYKKDKENLDTEQQTTGEQRKESS